jgi:alpha-glucosidase
MIEWTKIMRVVGIAFLVVVSIKSRAQSNKIYRVVSIDKSTAFEVKTDGGKLVYRMVYAGKEVTTWSQLGFQANEVLAGENTTIRNRTQRTNKEMFTWRLGEDDVIENNYNEMILSCTAAGASFNLIARIYDGSVAFRYAIHNGNQAGGNLQKEFTAFTFNEPYTLYQYNHESVFTPVSIDTFTKTCDFPATLTNGKLFITVGEANNTGFTKAELKRGVVPHSLAIAIVRDTAVKVPGSFVSPWRTISVSNTAIGLHNYSQLYLKLNPPAASGIPAWIKPGKLIRAQLNTQSGLDCIDFAAKHNFQYIMFDAGWYGAEFRGTSDPTQVIPQIDMPEIIRHGKDKGIGVILYVNYVGLKAKLDTILSLYKKWGIAGLKFGFVDGLTHAGLTWLSSAIKKVNGYGFILDIHDNYKPTGLSRTYPALLTQEGIRGDENSPDAFHTTVLPFTLFLAGPVVFTFCYPN